MDGLWLCLLFLIFCEQLISELHRIENWHEWANNCGRRSGAPGNPKSWYAQVHNRERDVKYGAAIISKKHVITVKEAVLRTVDGSEVVDVKHLKIISIVPLIDDQQKICDVEHTLIPVKMTSEFDEPELLNLVILQTVESFHPNVTYICPMPFKMNSRRSYISYAKDREVSVVSEGRDSGKLVMRRPDTCADWKRHCEEFLRFEPDDRVHHIGDIWYERRPGYQFDEIVGIRLNANTRLTLSVPFWSHFICKHTGACRQSLMGKNMDGLSDFHYLLDGQLNFDTCSDEDRRAFIRQTTSFRRISHAELVSLRNECGKSVNNGIPEEDASFFVAILGDEKVCPWDEKLLKYVCKPHIVRMCFGALISHSHVLSSAECLKKILLKNTKVAVIFSKPNGDHETADSFPFQEQDLIIPGYDTSSIGKRWLKIDRVITPYTGNMGIHDIAILQLEQPIPTDSYIKPICLAHKSLEIHEKLTLARFENMHNLSNRKISMSNINRAPADCLNLDNCKGFAISEQMMINQETMGSPIFFDRKGRKYLVGLLSSQLANRIRKPVFIRPSLYASFICLHTGVCDEEEQLSSWLFLPFDYPNMITPPSVILEIMKLWKSSTQLEWVKMLKDMDDMAKVIASYKHNLNRLSREEYEELQHECGKAAPQNRILNGKDFELTQHPWTVTISPKYTFYDPAPNCGGAFISRRHVVTAKHCVNKADKYIVLFGSLRPDDLDTMTEKQVKTIAFFEPYEQNENSFYDLAILELFENIEPTPHVQILCLGDSTTYANEKFAHSAMVFGGGRGSGGLNGKIQYLEYNFTAESGLIRQEMDGGIERIGWQNAAGRSKIIQGDSGGPLVRRRLSDNRYTLYGVQIAVENNTAIAHYVKIGKALDSICRITGVCPNGDFDPKNLHEITVNGLRLC